MKKVYLKSDRGLDVLVDPEFISHVTPSGLPGCSVLYSKITGFLVIVLGDVRDVAEALGIGPPA